MKTKFWKNIISSFFLALFCVQNILSDDVRLKVTETSINNLAAAIIESKYLSYGTHLVPNVPLVNAQ